jgi:hypothetical protein
MDAGTWEKSCFCTRARKKILDIGLQAENNSTPRTAQKGTLFVISDMRCTAFDGIQQSDTVKGEVNADFYCCAPLCTAE